MENNPNKPIETIAGLRVETRTKLSAAAKNAVSLGLHFKNISEQQAAKAPDVEILAEQAAQILTEFEKIREEYQRKLNEVSNKIYQPYYES